MINVLVLEILPYDFLLNGEDENQDMMFKYKKAPMELSCNFFKFLVK